MAKDRDWVDYVNLGSNVVQNIQLSDVQGKLGAVASIAAGQQAVADAENHRRETVFMATNILRDMRVLAAENRAGVLALAKEALTNFKNGGIFSANFRAYEDKERVHSLIEDYKALVEECATTLTPNECAEVDLCVQYLIERRAFNEFLKLRQKQEELEEVESQLRILEAKSKPSNVATVIGGLLIVGGIVSFVVWIADDHSTENGWVIGLIILVVGFVVCAAGANSKGSKMAETQAEKVKKLRSNVKAQFDMNYHSKKQFAQWRITLPSKSVCELKTLQMEREALITKVLKKGELSHTAITVNSSPTMPASSTKLANGSAGPSIRYIGDKGAVVSCGGREIRIQPGTAVRLTDTAFTGNPTELQNVYVVTEGEFVWMPVSLSESDLRPL